MKKMLAAFVSLPTILRQSVQSPFPFPSEATSFQGSHHRTHKQKIYLLNMFLYGVEKTVSVTDDPSTSAIKFHYTEMPYQLVSRGFTSLFLR